MPEEQRNRSQGWKYAKSDGHRNEEDFARTLLDDSGLVSALKMNYEGFLNDANYEIDVDGSKHVKSIFDDMTTSKIDITIYWKTGQQLGISLKKSNSGQVWLVSLPRFISAIEHHLSIQIDPLIRKGLSLFIGGSNLEEYRTEFDEVIAKNQTSKPAIAQQEVHQNRLVASSIMESFPSVWDSTLKFLNSHLDLITRLSFAQGLAASDKDSADVVVYNMVKNDPKIFKITTLTEKMRVISSSNPVVPGPRNGGSTILLPTGFLQMHHPQEDNLLQFHHQYKKISAL